MFLRVIAALAAALSLSCPAASRPFTAKDLAMLDRVSDPRLSPDGRFIAYARRSTDWEGNKGVYALELIDRTNAEAKPAVLVKGEGAPLNPQWSRDGKWIYFVSSRSGTQQVWRISPAGGEETQITALPLGINGFQLGPDGQKLIALIDTLPECETLACTKAAADAFASRKSSGALIKPTGPSRPWTGFENELLTGLFSVPIGGSAPPTEATSLLKTFRGVLYFDPNFTIGGDGKVVYFLSGQPGQYMEEPDTAKLYVVPADGSAAPRQISSVDTTNYSNLTISPDGRTLAILAKENWVGGFSRTAIMLMDIKSGKMRKIAPQLDLRISAISWSADGSTILATAPELGQVPLMAIDVKTGVLRKIQTEGRVANFDSASGVITFSADSLTSPAQIFDVSQSGERRQLTHIGAEVFAEAPPAATEQFSFVGWNGEKVFGWLIKPQNFAEGQKYPVALLVHGGPNGNFDNSWSYRWNPQVWAGMGFAVVMIDFHGSDGYGEAFGKSVANHWGDRPLEDLQKGWAYALSHYSWLDGNRACALGGSYGGYLINWMAGQWSAPWKCLVSHAGTFDRRVDALTTFLTGYYDTQNAGLTPLAPEAAERFNPLSYAANWKSPILITHGALDVLVPFHQGIAAFTAARRVNVPSELLTFPDEGHLISKPQNSVQWYDVVEEWMRRWVGK